MKKIFFYLVMFCLILLTSKNFAQSVYSEPPVVAEVPSKIYPAIPTGLKVTCLKGPETLQPSADCPVIEWNEYTYWAFSFIDNRVAMSIVAYDYEGNIVKRWDKSGARYVYRITVDTTAETVTFWGQSDEKIVMNWDEIYLKPPPVVGKVPSKVHPAVPSGLKVTCLQGPETLQPSTDCPVIEWNDYTYWTYSFVDNRVAMSIIAYDIDGNTVKRWDKSGSRYVYKITVNTTAETVTFWGQSDEKIVMSWDELYLEPAPVVESIPSKIHPTVPPGLKVTCLEGPETLQSSTNCPVLEWYGYTYWAYSYVDNRNAMCIVAYDSDGNVVKQWEKSGARYVYKITVDTAEENVTFWGQSDEKIVMNWDKLIVK